VTSRPRLAAVGTLNLTVIGGMPIWLLTAFAAAIGAQAGFDGAGLGLFVGLAFVGSAVTAVAAGRLVARFGWRAGALFAAAFTTASLTALALGAQAPVVIVVAMLLSALGNSAAQPAANLAITELTRPSRVGLSFGIKQASLPIATFLVGLSLPFFQGPDGWRGAFVATAGLAAVSVVLIALSGGRPAPSIGLRPERVSGPVTGRLWLLALSGGLGTAATMSLGAFYISATVGDLGIGAASFAVATGSGLGIVARIGWGMLADRGVPRLGLWIGALQLVGAFGLALIALGSPAPVIIGGIVAYGLGWSWNSVFHLAAVRSSSRSPAESTGVIQMSIATGAAAGPPVFGLIASADWTVAWVVYSVVLVLASVPAFVHGRRDRPGGRQMRR
jgi:hypothetical protein